MKRIIFFITSLTLSIFLVLTPACTKAEPEEVEEVIEEQVKENTDEPEEVSSETIEKIEETPIVETLEEEKEKEFSPTIVSTLPAGLAANVYVEGNYAYFVGNTYNIIDITDKENPRNISLHIPAMSWWRSGLCLFSL